MIPKRVMLSVLATTDSSGIRVAEFRGSEHTIIPCVALVEGVLWPANSPHPELALAEEFGRFPEGWNGSPIVYDHPKVNGVHVAASSPGILEDNAVGQLFNTVLEDGKLKTELWIDNALVANLSEEGQAQIENLKSGDEVVEVSTGLFMMSEMAEGDFDGEHYNAIWRNIVPDHLAILPPGVPGACSIADGCGAPRMNTSTSDRTTDFVPVMRAASLNTNAEDCGCDIIDDPDIEKSLFQSLMAKGSKFFNFIGSADHLSDGDVRTALSGALNSIEDQYTFIVSVFSANDKGTFVYEVGFGDGLFERTFKIKNNKVTIGDDAIMVRPETKFVPVEVVTNEANSITQENAMNKDELVTGLIANKATQFTVDDKDFLDGLTEDQLQKMVPVANEEAPAAPVVEPTGDRNAADLLSAGEEEVTAPVTTEDYIADAPPEVQQILNSGLKMHRARKDALITALTANARNQFTKEQLESKDVTELETIVALASDISYEGNGPVAITALSESDAIPSAPAVFDLSPKKADAA